MDKQTKFYAIKGLENKEKIFYGSFTCHFKFRLNLLECDYLGMKNKDIHIIFHDALESIRTSWEKILDLTNLRNHEDQPWKSQNTIVIKKSEDDWGEFDLFCLDSKATPEYIHEISREMGNLICKEIEFRNLVEDVIEKNPILSNRLRYSPSFPSEFFWKR